MLAGSNYSSSTRRRKLARGNKPACNAVQAKLSGQGSDEFTVPLYKDPQRDLQLRRRGRLVGEAGYRSRGYCADALNFGAAYRMTSAANGKCAYLVNSQSSRLRWEEFLAERKCKRCRTLGGRMASSRTPRGIGNASREALPSAVAVLTLRLRETTILIDFKSECRSRQELPISR
jgi:hypothetical protein